MITVQKEGRVITPPSEPTTDDSITSSLVPTLTDTTLKPVQAHDNTTLNVLTEMVMSAHGRSLEHSAGLQGVNKYSRAQVEAIMYTVFTVKAGEYHSLEEQAADVAVKLATAHCFPDGNKRTAVLTAAVIMEAYGRSVACSQESFVRAALAAVNKDNELVEHELSAGDYQPL